MTFRIVCLLAIVFWPMTIRGAEPAARRRPNVLFLISDDMRPDLGCYGNPMVKSPNLDALAAAGVRFNRAYAQYPLCNPSRTSLLTGHYPDRTGVMDNYSYFGQAHPDYVTLPKYFKQNGYVSLRAGKVFHEGIDDTDAWTEGGEERKPIDRSKKPSTQPAARKGGPGKAADDGSKPSEDGVAKPAATAGDSKPTGEAKPTGEVNPSGSTAGVSTGAQGHTDDDESNEPVPTSGPDRRIVLKGDGEDHVDYKVADQAIAYLEKHKDEPFFLACGFVKPHAPPSAPQRFYDLYDASRIPLPADFMPVPTVPPGFPAQSVPTRNSDLFVGRKATPRAAREMIQAYWASISWTDWNVGRVIAALDRLGLRDNTIVLFWGDHGYHLGEKGKWSKHQSMFEVGTRVPLIVDAPGAAGNGKPCNRLVESLSVYPTLLELCGLPPAQGLEGRSLKPLLDNPAAEWKHPAFTFSGNAGKMIGSGIRTERFHYVEYVGGGAMLFDLQIDKDERKNLAEEPAFSKQRAALAEQLRKFRER